MIRTRRKSGLTQADLATCLGKPQSFISKYERGERRLDVIEFIQVMEVLGVDPAELIRQLETEVVNETKHTRKVANYRP